MATKATGTDPAAQKLEQRKAATAEPDPVLVKVLWQKFLDKPTPTSKTSRRQPAQNKSWTAHFRAREMQIANVRYWHLADIGVCTAHIRL
jgi:hypothetical protein